MAFIPDTFDCEANEAVLRSESSREGAIDALRIAAKYLRKGKALPSGMDRWLADAFENATTHPERYSPDNGDVGHALLVCLGLKANNRRKKSSWVDVGIRIEKLTRNGKSLNKAMVEVAANLDIGYSTVARYWKKSVRAEEEYNAACREAWDDYYENEK